MPKDEEKKRNQITVRFTDSQLQEIKEMSKKADRSEADFIRIATMKYIAIKKESDEL